MCQLFYKGCNVIMVYVLYHSVSIIKLDNTNHCVPPLPFWGRAYVCNGLVIASFMANQTFDLCENHNKVPWPFVTAAVGLWKEDIIGCIFYLFIFFHVMLIIHNTYTVCLKIRNSSLAFILYMKDIQCQNFFYTLTFFKEQTDNVD